MNTIRRIVKNILSLFASQLNIAILSLILSIYIARVLGDNALGKYSFIIAFPRLFLVLLDLGYETLLIRNVSRKKSLASEYLGNILGFRLLLIPIILTLIVIVINIMGYPNDTKYLVYLFSIYFVLLSVSSVFRVTFRAFEKMEFEAGINIFTAFLRIPMSLFFLHIGYSLIEIGYIFIFSAIIEIIISYLLCKKIIVKPEVRIDLLFVKNTIKFALPLALVSIFGLIFVKIDTVMLSYMKGDDVVGWYNAAYNLTQGFSAIPILLMNVLLPLLSYYYIYSKQSLKKGYEKSFKFLFYLGLPLSIGIFMIADNIIYFFYGLEFINSIIALKILAWDILLKFLYLCTSFVLISINRQKQMTIIVISTAMLNIFLNLLLIPGYSYIGSGIATLITEIFLLIMYFYLIIRDSLNPDIKKFLFQPLIASIIMAFFLWHFSNIELFIKIIFSIMIYFVILILLKGFSMEDMIILRQLINRKK